MAIVTNLKSLKPRRETYKREITLVSGGFYNQKAFPEGKITVYPWDSNVDGWFLERLRQPNREKALWEVIYKVTDLEHLGVKYQDMPIGDIMTILMVSRSIRNDCVLEYTARCPKCDKAYVDKITVPDELSKIGQKKSDYPGYEEIVLPDTKDKVVLKVLFVRDELMVTERSPESKQDIPDAEALILASIVSVGGGKAETIQEAQSYVRALSSKDETFLARQRALISPQLDTSFKILCDGCGEEYEHVLDINRDFFRAT